MTDNKSFEGLDLSDIGISIDNFVATVEIQRPPNNFFDTGLINDLANIISQMDQSDEVRAVVLCSEGKHFCAGNDFSNAARNTEKRTGTQALGTPYTRRQFACLRQKLRLWQQSRARQLEADLGLRLCQTFGSYARKLGLQRIS